MCSDIPTQNMACRAGYATMAPCFAVPKVLAIWEQVCPLFCCTPSQLYDISVVNRRTDKLYSLKMLQCEVSVLMGSICLDLVPVLGSSFNQYLDYKAESESEKQKSLFDPQTFAGRLLLGSRIIHAIAMAQEVLNTARGLNEVQEPLILGADNIRDVNDIRIDEKKSDSISIVKERLTE